MVEIKERNDLVNYENVNISGWKGKSEFSISEAKEYYRVIEARKSKETGEFYEEETIIPRDNVVVLWDLIRDKCEMGVKYDYRYLVRLILEHYKFHEIENQNVENFMEAFNGGKWRATYYFPFLYYPIKVLEKKGLLMFFGRGGILRISGADL